MRGILTLIILILVYYALKTVVRSAVQAYYREEKRPRIMGEDMVLDPQCSTYVVKERAVTRTVRGTTTYFCSEACAARFEERRRG